MKINTHHIHLYVSLILLALGSCGEKLKNDQKENNIKFSTGKDSTATNSVQNGISTQRYPNGRKKIEGYMANGKRTGNWMAWYENGILWSQGNYLEGKRNGYAALYYPDGKLRAEGSYKNDKKTGLWRFFLENGSLQKEIDFDKNPSSETPATK